MLKEVRTVDNFQRIVEALSTKEDCLKHFAKKIRDTPTTRFCIKLWRLKKNLRKLCSNTETAIRLAHCSVLPICSTTLSLHFMLVWSNRRIRVCRESLFAMLAECSQFCRSLSYKFKRKSIILLLGEAG